MIEKIGEERILYLLRKGSPVYDPGLDLQVINKNRHGDVRSVFNN